MVPISVYLHIPFCAHRCAYCDFNTYTGLETILPDYVSALCSEIRTASRNFPDVFSAQTIYFGGGTPSILPLSEFDRIFAVLREVFLIDSFAEITLEANPGALTLDYLKGLRKLGFNRLSLGVQSAHPAELRLLERIHDFSAAVQSYSWARQAGFERINLDLIYGLPEQTLGSWQRTLRLILNMQPEHLSLYSLTLEPNTPFGRWAQRGLLTIPNPDGAADMYEWASEQLSEKGYIQYEISNWAKLTPGELLLPTASPGLACRHNLQYWRNRPYFGFGAGAHGSLNKMRTSNVLHPLSFIQRLQTEPIAPSSLAFTPAVETVTSIDRQTEIGETMMMALRLTREGISEAAFEERFGCALMDIFPEQINRLMNWSLLERVSSQAGQVLRLTRHGRLLGNRVFAEFI